jgi:hypothetical protein
MRHFKKKQSQVDCEKWILAQRNTPSHAHAMTNRLDTLGPHARARARRTPPTGVDTELTRGFTAASTQYVHALLFSL